MENQKFFLIIGAMRSGKSFFCNELIKQYSAGGWAAMVYNLGKRTDFAAAREVFALSLNEHLRLIPDKKRRAAFKEFPFLEFYKDPKNGKLYTWADINKPFAAGGIVGSPIKFDKLEPYSERLFFEAFYKYAANTLLVLDDMRGTFRNGLKAEFLELFSRINHAGKESAALNWQNAGATVAILLHSLDDVNEDLYKYATHVVNFKYSFAPDFRQVTNPLLRAEIEKSFLYLQNAPQYTHTITDVETGTTAAKRPTDKNYFLI